MQKKEVLQVAKELIFIAGTYNIKNNSVENEKLLKKINNYEEKIINSKTDYTKIVLSFIEDIKGDILAGRDINIDNSQSDEYIENYFITKNEVELNNTLILLKEYKEIFSILYSKKQDLVKVRKNIEKIVKNFDMILNKINSKNISKNLLIYTLFKRNKPASALYRLSLILLEFDSLSNEYKKIQDLTKKYNFKINEVYIFGKKYLEKNNYNVKFLLYKTDTSGNVNISNKSTNASESLYRTGNAKFEYKFILKNIKK